MTTQITAPARALNISADFLQYVGAWDYNSMTEAGKLGQIVTAEVDENGNVSVFGEEPNLAAVDKIRKIVSSPPTIFLRSPMSHLLRN